MAIQCCISASVSTVRLPAIIPTTFAAPSFPKILNPSKSSMKVGIPASVGIFDLLPGVTDVLKGT